MPEIMSVKKIPMERTMAAFWKTPDIPAPAPRWSGGRLFMIAARLGEANSPMARPLIAIRMAKGV